MDGSASLSESLFDPIELLGSQVPFVDPFGYDDCAFQTVDPALPRSLNRVLLSNLRSCLSSPISLHSRFQEDCQEPLEPKHIVQHAPIALQPEVVPERVRLGPDQAIYIFKQREAKTARTAALLSAEYGVSSKAIRDIWTRKSWAEDTRPYWTLLDK